MLHKSTSGGWYIAVMDTIWGEINYFNKIACSDGPIGIVGSPYTRSDWLK